MRYQFHLNRMAVFRAVLYIKAVAILAGLILALVQHDRPAQTQFIWPTSLVLLMLILFGTAWFEKVAGRFFFPLGLMLAVILQAIELSWQAPLSPSIASPIGYVAGSASLAGFRPIEPFFFLLVPLVLLGWYYGSGGALAGVGTAILLHTTLILAAGEPGRVDLLAMLARMVMLAGSGGLAVLLSASIRPQGLLRGLFDTARAAPAAPDSSVANGRTNHDRAVEVLTGLGQRLEGLVEDLPDTSDAVRHTLGRARSGITEAAHMLSQSNRADFHSGGLVDALHQCADNFKQRTGVDVALRLHLDPDGLAPEHAATAMEIVEQALDSVAGGPGEQASVSLLCSGSHVALSVHGERTAPDMPDPRGEDNDARLVALRRRAESVGGIFCVSHQAQHGTTVACVFPRSTDP